MGYTIWPDGPSGDAVRDVYKERLRQEELRRTGKFPYTCATPDGLTDAEKLGVLAEEFGEVSKLVCQANIPNRPLQEGEDRSIYHRDLKEELIQVAAVCVAWAETL